MSFDELKKYGSMDEAFEAGKSIQIESTEIEKSIKSVGKTFSIKAFQDLIDKFSGKIDVAEETSKKIQVRGTESEKTSIEMAATAKKLDKVIDGARMSAKRPYLDFNSALDKIVRPLQKRLKAIETGERKKCVKFRNDLLAKEQEQERKDAMAMPKEKISLGGLNIPAPKAPIAAEAKVDSRSDSGSGSYKKVPEAELVDLSKVPVKYLAVDWRIVNEDIKNGITKIPGFNIKEVMKMTLRS
jgi:hypothetical protein